MVVFGGLGHVWGGVVGAMMTIIDDFTRDYLPYRMLMFGMVIVLVVIFMPRDIGGIIDDFLCAGASRRCASDAATAPQTARSDAA